MNTPRLLSVVALSALCLLSRVSATLWTGTITEQVTNTSNPLVAIGESYVGSYQYESDTIDGTFSSYVGLLNFDLDSFVPQDGNFHVTMSYGADDSVSHLTVQNGIVTDFRKSGQGYFDFGFTLDTFFTGVSFSGRYFVTSGTLSFSAPVAVPDTGASTLVLILSGICCMFTFHRTFKKIS